MYEISLSPVSDFDSLGIRWRELEAHADCSFFQSWTWVGCLAEERYTDPILLEARHGGRLIALGLLNRRRFRFAAERLWLAESGAASLDAIFVEHNGPLVKRGTPSELLQHYLRAAIVAPLAGRGAGFGRMLTLSGVGPDHLDAARRAGAVRVRAVRPAPYVDLAAIRAAGSDWLAWLSANTRQQLRRSARRYAEIGPLALRRAESPAEALSFLDELAALHQATWTRRGRPGAFANPDFVRFHRALIGRGLVRGEVDLLRVTAGDRPIGYLYNFRFRGQALSYQSGFDYAGADGQRKPGLTCHHLAIEAYGREGMDGYDFLAGEDRYKASLATARRILYWLDLAPRASPAGLAFLARGLVRALRGVARRDGGATERRAPLNDRSG